MAIYLKITNPTEVVKKKTSNWLTDLTPERIDRKLVEDEVIKGIIEQLTLEGIKGCLLYTSPSPRDHQPSRMPSSA